MAGKGFRGGSNYSVFNGEAHNRWGRYDMRISEGAMVTATETRFIGFKARLKKAEVVR